MLDQSVNFIAIKIIISIITNIWISTFTIITKSSSSDSGFIVFSNPWYQGCTEYPELSWCQLCRNRWYGRLSVWQSAVCATGVKKVGVITYCLTNDDVFGIMTTLGFHSVFESWSDMTCVCALLSSVSGNWLVGTSKVWHSSSSSFYWHWKVSTDPWVIITYINGDFHRQLVQLLNSNWPFDN